MIKKENRYSIKTIYLHLTQKCNLNCRHCYISAGKYLSDELTTFELKNLWIDIVKIVPEKIVLTGGEPFVRNDIFELTEYFSNSNKDARIKIVLNTSGNELNETNINLIKNRIDEINISIDGMQDVHDNLRGKGQFQKALNAFNLLNRAGIKSVAKILVWSKSLPQISQLINYLSSEGINRISLIPCLAIGRAIKHTDILIDQKEFLKILTQIFGQLPNHKKKCGAGKYISIYPNGDLFPCHSLTTNKFRLGNIREDTLSELLIADDILPKLRSINYENLISNNPSINKIQVMGCPALVLRELPLTH